MITRLGLLLPADNVFPTISPNFDSPFVRLLSNVTGFVQGAAITIFVLLLIGAGVMIASSKLGGNQRGQHLGIGGVGIAVAGLILTIAAPMLVNWFRTNPEITNVSSPAVVIVEPTNHLSLI